MQQPLAYKVSLHVTPGTLQDSLVLFTLHQSHMVLSLIKTQVKFPAIISWSEA